MSRAYCLNCNEQVMVTASGTCPSGHRVAPDHAGPEPWVGNAGEQEPTAAAVQDVDLAALQQLQVAGAVTGGTNGNGHTAAHGHPARNGHAPANGTNTAPEDDAAPSTPTVHRERANSQASDDLAAMLAEALQSEGDDPVETPAASAPPPEAAPAADPTSAPPSDADDDEAASDLAALAAELQLDTSLPSDTEAEQPSAPASPTPDPAAEIWSSPAPPEPEAEPTWPSDVADTADEDLSSPASVAEPVLDQTPPPPAETPEADSGPPVDLTNFTARGTRVGAPGTPGRRLFGRKR